MEMSVSGLISLLGPAGTQLGQGHLQIPPYPDLDPGCSPVWSSFIEQDLSSFLAAALNPLGGKGIITGVYEAGMVGKHSENTQAPEETSSLVL